MKRTTTSVNGQENRVKPDTTVANNAQEPNRSQDSPDANHNSGHSTSDKNSPEHTFESVAHQIFMREILADLDTPLSTYLKVANAPGSYCSSR